MSAAHHMDEELLAMFAEGRLTADEAKEVAGHVAGCAPCLQVVRAVNETIREERDEPWYRNRWLAVAAIVAFAVVAGIFVFRTANHPSSPVARLVELSPRDARPVEARLTGGFAWAPYRGPVRATDGSVSTQQMKLTGAVGGIVENAGRDGSAGAQHAAGIALVLVRQPEEAIARLEASAKQSNDAKVWSDLGAARYLAASQLGRASLYPTALAAEDKALRIDPNLSEALFNRALILERLGLTGDAKRAWETYLRTDSSSQWAAEARSRLAQLQGSTHFVEFERDRPLLEAAAARGDDAAVRRYVSSHRELARRYAEGEYLGHWAEALLRNDIVEAERWLSTARGIGEALFALSGEALLRDAVSVIDQAAPQERHAIAEAHVLYRSGRIAYSHDQRDTGGRDLHQAADAFEKLHDPMAFQARLSAASARRTGNDSAGARRDLQQLMAVADQHPGYLALGAYARWELGLSLIGDDDWYGASGVLADGAAIAQRAGERESEGFINTNLAFALEALGRNDDAWLARIRGFSALSSEGNDPQRLATAVAGATYAELSAGHLDAALALTSTEALVAHGAARPYMAINGLIARTILQGMNGDPTSALATSRRAGELAASVSDPQMRATWQAKVDVATGAALAEQTPRAANEPLTHAIDFYEAHGMAGALPDPLLLRSRCATRIGDVAGAMRDLERGMSIVETHPGSTSGTTAGWSLLDADHALFTDAIRLSLDHGDKAAAFAYAERSHGTRVTIAEIQRRLAGSGTAVLEFVALPDEMVTFAISGDDAVAVRHPVAMDGLARLADDSLSETGTAAAAKLYDELIRPADRSLDRASEVVIVADPRLATVPFAALYDSVHRRYLTERLAVATATSAGSLQEERGSDGARTLAAIALPTGGADSAGLPDAENEVQEIAALYPSTVKISSATTFADFRAKAATSGVIHISGHTERQIGGGEQALLFGGESGSLDRVTWKSVVASPLPQNPVVVLAACETLRPPSSSATRALSLGSAFSAAGADDVIGTLTPVGDRDARVLFQAIHRQLASGARPAEALRAAQLESIATEKNTTVSHAWRAIALLTRRIPAPGVRKESHHG